MDLNKDYYKILGVDKKATQEQIKTSFRKLAKQHHPDAKESKDDTMIKQINEAYTILNDEVSRRQYDQQSNYGANFNPAANPFSFFGNFGNFADSVFGQAGTWFSNDDLFSAFFKREEYSENLDIVYNVNLSMIDIYNNNNVVVKFKRYVKCEECDWTGFDINGESFQCDACDGKGHIRGRICELCRGTGQIHSGVCKKCNGSKIVLKDEEFNLSNTYNITESFDKYMPHVGHQSKYYRNKVGNLILKVNYNKDNRYQIQPNKDILYTLNLHFQYAIDGFEFEYLHLDNKKYKIKIPSKTRDGDLLKIEKKGLIINNKLDRSDLLFKINIFIDYNLVELAKSE
jgi:molecular chaperone DnaJ